MYVLLLNLRHSPRSSRKGLDPGESSPLEGFEAEGRWEQARSQSWELDLWELG